MMSVNWFSVANVLRVNLDCLSTKNLVFESLTFLVFTLLTEAAKSCLISLVIGLSEII